MNANKQDAGGEVTNPDNAGGLNDHAPVPLSEELRIEAALISGDVYVRGDAFVARMTRMAERAERLEELCRAAPTGGDARTVPFSDWMEAQHELGELRTMLARSAPAASGEPVAWIRSDGVTTSDAGLMRHWEAQGLQFEPLVRALSRGVPEGST